MHFDILHFIRSNIWLVLALCGVGVLYFLLNKIFGGPKQKPGEDDEDEDEDGITLREPKKEEPEVNKHKIKKGYSEHTSSYMSGARDYSYIPKDGSAVRVNNYNRTRKIDNIKKDKDELKIKEQVYSEIFYVKMIEDLNVAAKYAKIPNDQLEKDLKIFKKQGKFQDVSIDIINNKIIYTNSILDRSEQILYTEEQDETEIDNGIHFDNGMSTHKCPYCGTDNIIDSHTKKYNCFYCLKEVKIWF